MKAQQIAHYTREKMRLLQIAVKKFERALLTTPDNALTLYQLSRTLWALFTFLRNTNGNKDEIVRLLEQCKSILHSVIKLRPSFAVCYIDLLVCYIEIAKWRKWRHKPDRDEHYDKAQQLFKKVLLLDQDQQQQKKEHEQQEQQQQHEQQPFPKLEGSAFGHVNAMLHKLYDESVKEAKPEYLFSITKIFSILHESFWSHEEITNIFGGKAEYSKAVRFYAAVLIQQADFESESDTHQNKDRTMKENEHIYTRVAQSFGLLLLDGDATVKDELLERIQECKALASEKGLFWRWYCLSELYRALFGYTSDPCWLIPRALALFSYAQANTLVQRKLLEQKGLEILESAPEDTLTEWLHTTVLPSRDLRRKYIIWFARSSKVLKLFVQLCRAHHKDGDHDALISNFHLVTDTDIKQLALAGYFRVYSRRLDLSSDFLLTNASLRSILESQNGESESEAFDEILLGSCRKMDENILLLIHRNNPQVRTWMCRLLRSLIVFGI
eukprot:TRINITY_DN2320_c0_g2_i1.p1 TRINITY_DN2320_c0_g2~~TRINITY_DN2320_c0_g2_i1.p1  ORF type:complete len:566 (-),score=115.72 TRINITY_DN2320_c0_g2_i1:351-1844(-)